MAVAASVGGEAAGDGGDERGSERCREEVSVAHTVEDDVVVARWRGGECGVPARM